MKLAASASHLSRCSGCSQLPARLSLSRCSGCSQLPARLSLSLAALAAISCRRDSLALSPPSLTAY
jgi:hypothetical protein